MYHLNLKLFSPTYLPRDFILGIYWTLYLVSVDLQMIAENFVHIHMQYTQYIYILALIKSISPGSGRWHRRQSHLSKFKTWVQSPDPTHRKVRTDSHKLSWPPHIYYSMNMCSHAYTLTLSPWMNGYKYVDKITYLAVSASKEQVDGSCDNEYSFSGTSCRLLFVQVIFLPHSRN